MSHVIQYGSSLSLPLIRAVSIAWKRFDNMNFKRKRADVLAHNKGYICQHPLSQLTELRHVRICSSSGENNWSAFTLCFALQQLIRTGLDVVEMKENPFCLEVTRQSVTVRWGCVGEASLYKQSSRKPGWDPFNNHGHVLPKFCLDFVEVYEFSATLWTSVQQVCLHWQLWSEGFKKVLLPQK